MTKHSLPGQVLRSTTGAEWIVLHAEFGWSGSLRSVEVISDRDAGRGHLQHAFRMNGAEFRIFCAHAGIRADSLVRTEAFADSLS